MRLSVLANEIGAELVGDDRLIAGVAELGDADNAHLAALFEPRYRRAARSTQAGAVLVSPELVDVLPEAVSRLVSDSPREAWGAALRLLYPAPAVDPPPVGVHASAVIEPRAVLGEGVRVGPFVSVGAETWIGPNVVLHAGATVGAHVQIGADTVVHPRAVILDGAEVGARVHIGAGTVIGEYGFGLDAAGRVPQIGRVIIEDDASIGANSCVDRATIGATVIGRGAHLDNLVQVGHNARVGAGAVLCGQVGVAGGAIIEPGAVIGGQAGVAGRARVGANAKVAAQSGVTRDLAPNGTYSGHPAEDNRTRLKRLAKQRKT